MATTNLSGGDSSLLNGYTDKIILVIKCNKLHTIPKKKNNKVASSFYPQSQNNIIYILKKSYLHQKTYTEIKIIQVKNQLNKEYQNKMIWVCICKQLDFKNNLFVHVNKTAIKLKLFYTNSENICLIINYFILLSIYRMFRCRLPIIQK